MSEVPKLTSAVSRWDEEETGQATAVLTPPSLAASVAKWDTEERTVAPTVPAQAQAAIPSAPAPAPGAPPAPTAQPGGLVDTTPEYHDILKRQAGRGDEGAKEALRQREVESGVHTPAGAPPPLPHQTTLLYKTLTQQAAEGSTEAAAAVKDIDTREARPKLEPEATDELTGFGKAVRDVARPWQNIVRGHLTPEQTQKALERPTGPRGLARLFTSSDPIAANLTIGRAEEAAQAIQSRIKGAEERMRMPRQVYVDGKLTRQETEGTKAEAAVVSNAYGDPKKYMEQGYRLLLPAYQSFAQRLIKEHPETSPEVIGRLVFEQMTMRLASMPEEQRRLTEKERRNKEGWLKKLAKSPAKGTFQTESSLLSAAGMVTNLLGGGINPDVGAETNTAGNILTDMAKEMSAYKDRTYADTASWADNPFMAAGQGFGEMIPYLLIGAAAVKGGPPALAPAVPGAGGMLAPAAAPILSPAAASFWTMVGVEGGAGYQQSKDKGEPERTAQLIGATTGLVNGTLEYVSRIFGLRLAFPKAVYVNRALDTMAKLAEGKAGGRVLSGLLAEGIPEFLQEITPELVTSMVTGEDIDPAMMKNAMEAGFTGGFVGLVGGAAGSVGAGRTGQAQVAPPAPAAGLSNIPAIAEQQQAKQAKAAEAVPTPEGTASQSVIDRFNEQRIAREQAPPVAEALPTPVPEAARVAEKPPIQPVAVPEAAKVAEQPPVAPQAVEQPPSPVKPAVEAAGGKDLGETARRMADQTGRQFKGLDWVISGDGKSIEAAHYITGRIAGTIDLKTGEIIPSTPQWRDSLIALRDHVVEEKGKQGEAKTLDQLLNYPNKNADEIRQILARNPDLVERYRNTAVASLVENLAKPVEQAKEAIAQEPTPAARLARGKDFATLQKALSGDEMANLLGEADLELGEAGRLTRTEKRGGGAKVSMTKADFVDWVLGNKKGDDPATYAPDNPEWTNLVQRARQVISGEKMAPAAQVAEAPAAPVTPEAITEAPVAETGLPAGLAWDMPPKVEKVSKTGRRFKVSEAREHQVELPKQTVLAHLRDELAKSQNELKMTDSAVGRRFIQEGIKTIEGQIRKITQSPQDKISVRLYESAIKPTPAGQPVEQIQPELKTTAETGAGEVKAGADIADVPPADLWQAQKVSASIREGERRLRTETGAKAESTRSAIRFSGNELKPLIDKHPVLAEQFSKELATVKSAELSPVPKPPAPVEKAKPLEHMKRAVKGDIKIAGLPAEMTVTARGDGKVSIALPNGMKNKGTIDRDLTRAGLDPKNFSVQTLFDGSEAYEGKVSPEKAKRLIEAAKPAVFGDVGPTKDFTAPDAGQKNLMIGGQEIRAEKQPLLGLTKAKPAEAVSAFESLPAKSQAKFNELWDAADATDIAQQGLLDPNNKAWRAEFENRSGVKLPKTISGTNEAAATFFAKTAEAEEVEDTSFDFGKNVERQLSRTEADFYADEFGEEADEKPIARPKEDRATRAPAAAAKSKPMPRIISDVERLWQDWDNKTNNARGEARAVAKELIRTLPERYQDEIKRLHKIRMLENYLDNVEKLPLKGKQNRIKATRDYMDKQMTLKEMTMEDPSGEYESDIHPKDAEYLAELEYVAYWRKGKIQKDKLVTLGRKKFRQVLSLQEMQRGALADLEQPAAEPAKLKAKEAKPKRELRKVEFTAEEQAELDVARRQLGNLSTMGALGADKFDALVKIGTIYVKKGIREFGAWSEYMVGQVGDAVTPHLKAVWDKLKIQQGTSIKKDYNRIFREEFGFEKMTEPEKRGFQMLVDEANALREQDPDVGRRIVSRVTEAAAGDGDPTISDTEVAALSMAAIDLRQRIEANPNDTVARDDFLALLNAARMAGTTTARALNARKMLLANDYSLAKMLTDKAQANEGRVSDEQYQEAVRDYEEMKVARDEFREKLADAQTRISELESVKAIEKKVKELVAEEAQAQRKAPVDQTAWGAKNKIFTLERADAARKRLREKLSGRTLRTGLDPTILTDMVELGAMHLEAGARSFADWVAKMKEDLGNQFDDAEWTQAWDATRAEYGRNAREVVVGRLQKKVKQRGAPRPSAISNAAQQLAKAFAQEGVRDRKELVDAVHAELRQILPDITRAQTRDAISGYGRTKAVSKEESDIFLAQSKQEMQQIAKLEGLMKEPPVTPLKSGPQRQEQSAEHRRLTAQVHELMKQLGIVTTDPTRQLKSTLESMGRRLDGQIEDMEQELSTGERIVKTKAPTPTSPEIEAKRSRLAGLRKQREALFGYASRMLSDAQRQAIATNAVEKSIADYERRIREGELAPRSRFEKAEVSTPELEALRARRDALKAELEALRDAANPKKTPEQRALQAYKTRKMHQEAELREKIAAGDYTPPAPKRETQLDPEALAAATRVKQLQEKWREGLAKDLWKQKNLLEKAGAVVWAVPDMVKDIRASVDISGTGRQGLIMNVAHPIAGLIPMVKSQLRAFRSKEGAQRIEAEIESDPLYDDAVRAGLKIGPNKAHLGEYFESPISTHVPIVAGSARAYKAGLETLAFRVYKLLTQMKATEKPLTTAEKKQLAKAINMSMGRHAGPLMAAASRLLGKGYWAPNLIVNRIQWLAGVPLYGGTWRTRQIIAKEYARSLAGLGAMYSLILAGTALLRGPDDDDKPLVGRDSILSTNFGKVKIGKTVIDPWGGFQQPLVLAGRLWSGKKMTGSGQIVSIRGADVKYGMDDAADMILKFQRGKLAPFVGTGIDILAGRNMVGEPMTAGKIVQNLTVPMAPIDAYEALRAEGLTRGAALALLALLGINLQNRIERKGGLSKFRKLLKPGK